MQICTIFDFLYWIFGTEYSTEFLHVRLTYFENNDII